MFCPEAQGVLLMSSAENEISQDYLNPEYGAYLLEALPFFAGISRSDLARIYALGEVRLYKAATNIIIEGEVSEGMFLVLEGTVAIYKSGKTGAGDGHLLTHLGKGASFGELSFVDKQPRSATVSAQTRVVAYYLEGENWRNKLADNRDLALKFYTNFAEILSLRLRGLDEQFILSQKQLWKYALSRSGEVTTCQNSQKLNPSLTPLAGNSPEKD